MNMRNSVLCTIAIAIFATGLSARASAQAKQEEQDPILKFSQVPLKVQQTIKTFATEAEIKQITLGDVDGTKAYEFDIQKGGRKSEVAVTADGKVLSTEEIIPLAEVPDGARRAINAKAAGGKVVSTEKVFEHGKTAFEALIEKAGTQSTFAVAADGTTVGSEEEIPLSEVPEPARKTINSKASGGKVVSVKKVLEEGKTLFAAVIEKGGKQTEITVAPDGKIVDTEEIKH